MRVFFIKCNVDNGYGQISLLPKSQETLLQKCGSKVNFIYNINKRDTSRRSSTYTGT